MKEPFKFRYVNEIAGTFVLLAVLLMVAGIYLAGRAHGWFEPQLKLFTTFSAEAGSFGLVKGGEVRIMNTPAGHVKEVLPSDDGGIKVVFDISGPFQKTVRRSSVGTVKKKFGVAGDSFIELDVSDRAGELVKTGDQIRFKKEPDIMESVTATLQEIRQSLIPTLDEVKGIVARVSNIMKSIDEGKGAAGRLISDVEMGNTVKRIADDIQRTTEQLPGVASNTAAVAADARRVSQALAGEVGDLGGLMLQTQSTLRETERLIQGIQRHWLFRKYIEQPSGTDLIPAYEVPDATGGTR